ncbi:MAG: hypothetical protein F6K18_32725 [Okeania sp. SIO2C2]|nr:hypothetical protein [Okeania sp. SIO2C2]NEP91185.1 hypothetical protein [Okeania sp. SIO2C2]
MESFLVGVVDRRQETTHPSPLPRPWRGRQEKWIGSEEVGVKNCLSIFLP